MILFDEFVEPFLRHAQYNAFLRARMVAERGSPSRTAISPKQEGGSKIFSAVSPPADFFSSSTPPRYRENQASPSSPS
jgi:hypothetical protein